jgi:HEAT repeat protein
MEGASINTYAPPVNQLLTYGDARVVSRGGWPDYLELGLGPEHIPDLIRMATDNELNWANSDSLEVWAPLHAWRALGQLHAEEAVEPLLSLFEELEDSDWVMSELPQVFAMIGPAVLPTLAAYIADVSHSENARSFVISGIETIASKIPETRQTCIELLIKQLELFAENGPDVNASLILGLVELQAIEAAPLIERAFAAKSVDLSLMGDWEDVQVELGLLSAEELEERRSKALPETPFSSLTREMAFSQSPSKKSHQREAMHRKAKSKMAKQSRKKNRKR